MPEEHITTNFMDNAARDLSKPAIGKTQVRVIIAVVVAVVGFLIYNAVQFMSNLGKMNLMKNVLVSLERPGLRDGIAEVDVKVDNLNSLSVSNISFRYDILGPSGDTVASAVVMIPGTVPAGDYRTFPHVKLGALSQEAARMHAELVDARFGTKSKLTPEQDTQFTELAGMKDEEKKAGMERFITAVPSFVPAYIQLAHVYMDGENYTDAVRVLTKAVEVDPKDGDAHYQLGVALEHQGDKHSAGKQLKQALDMLPDDPNVQRTVQFFEP